MKLMDEISIS